MVLMTTIILSHAWNIRMQQNVLYLSVSTLQRTAHRENMLHLERVSYSHHFLKVLYFILKCTSLRDFKKIWKKMIFKPNTWKEDRLKYVLYLTFKRKVSCKLVKGVCKELQQLFREFLYDSLLSLAFISNHSKWLSITMLILHIRNRCLIVLSSLVKA